MIKINGEATLKVPYEVLIDISEEKFNSLSERKQDEMIDSHIDWHGSVQNAETDEISIDDIFTVETK